MATSSVLEEEEEEEEEDQEEEESLFKADAVNEEDSERDRATLCVEDEFRRATFLGETHPYPSWLRYCGSKVESSSTGGGGGGPRARLRYLGGRLYLLSKMQEAIAN